MSFDVGWGSTEIGDHIRGAATCEAVSSWDWLRNKAEK